MKITCSELKMWCAKFGTLSDFPTVLQQTQWLSNSTSAHSLTFQQYFGAALWKRLLTLDLDNEQILTQELFVVKTELPSHICVYLATCQNMTIFETCHNTEMFETCHNMAVMKLPIISLCLKLAMLWLFETCHNMTV